jgi:ABC-type transporter Mla maintaining outer membrane lipid asymmetry ATPase subunit MlaF
MKPFDYYSKPQTLYPHKKDYITFYVYDKGACIAEEKSGSGTGSITKSHLNQKYPNAVIQEVLDEDAYQAHSKEYNEERNKLHLEFQNDLFEDYDVSDNPKRFKCFELAWKHGRSFWFGGS